MRFSFARIAALVITVCLSLWSALANASAEPAFTGIAAKANDAISANRNPAGLARIKESEWTGQAIWFSSESTFVASDESAGGASVTEDSGDTVVPIVYYARPLTDRLGVGFSFQGLNISEDYGDDGPQRYLTEEYSLGTISFVPALGFKINDKWSVGGGVSFNYSYYELEAAVFNGIGEPDGRFKLDADDFNIGFTVGLIYEYSPHTRFGVRYQAENNPEMSGTPEYSNVITPRPTQKITVKSTFPQSFIVGGYHEFEDRSWVTADLLLIDFSEFGFTEFKIGDTSIEPQEQNFDDTWALTAGYNYWLDEKWILKVGGMYMDQPVSDENRTSTWRLDSMWALGLGAEYKISDKKMLAVNLTYMDLGSAPVRADDGQVGAIVGAFDERYALILDASFRWITGGKAIY